jgi:hypothetical protein
MKDLLQILGQQAVFENAFKPRSKVSLELDRTGWQ